MYIDEFELTSYHKASQNIENVKMVYPCNKLKSFKNIYGTMLLKTFTKRLWIEHQCRFLNIFQRISLQTSMRRNPSFRTETQF